MSETLFKGKLTISQGVLIRFSHDTQLLPRTRLSCGEGFFFNYNCSPMIRVTFAVNSLWNFMHVSMSTRCKVTDFCNYI